MRPARAFSFSFFSSHRSQPSVSDTRIGVRIPPGADYKLATYDQSVDYFKKLAATTRHMKIVEAGKTTQGPADVLRAGVEPDNLSRIDRYREIARRLAHPQAE
jgi:hypothetical protein